MLVQYHRQKGTKLRELEKKKKLVRNKLNIKPDLKMSKIRYIHSILSISCINPLCKK